MRPLPVIVMAVLGCSFYAGLSFLVTDPADYRFFPPFEPGVNRNRSDHLGAEYYSIAGALAAGRGFADPFRLPTGPTAWMAPVLPALLAALRRLSGDDRAVVTAVVVLLQDLTLIGTGVLVVELARRTTGQVRLAAGLFVAALGYDFWRCFQDTHDCWLVLALLDLLVAGLVWLRPLEGSVRVACGWGLFGGLCALANPVVGFAWGLLGLAGGWRRGRRARLALALLAAGLAVAPWVVRNYRVFGRLIPIKSNLAFELFQSQCAQPGGVLHVPIFARHPNAGDIPERRDYQRLGEMAYLDRKWELFRQDVERDPFEFARRTGNRFLEATLVYVPFNPRDGQEYPVRLWLARLVYPLPFLCLLALLLGARWRPLTAPERVVSAVYLLYLLPYVLISYYDRYKLPLIGLEVLLLLWGSQRAAALCARLRSDRRTTMVRA